MDIRPILLTIAVLAISFKTPCQPLLPRGSVSSNSVIKGFVLPQNFYSEHIGFFCKQELRIQKITKRNLFFRLGTKEYVDRLEKKHPY